MTDRSGRRTVSVRSWFALAAIAAFVMVVLVVFTSVLFLGDSTSSSQDRISDAADRLRSGADRWHDPAWRREASTRLGADDVTFTLFEGGDELYRSPLASDPVQDPERGDTIARFIEVEGSDPPLTAQVHTPVGADDPVPPIIRATLFIGAVAAAVSLFFGRPIVRSLRAVRQAALRVTDGDTAVSLPRSRITEIEDVNAAFDVMTTALDRSLEQQAELEQERRLFIAAIAHDLRTPLFSLRGYLEGLETGVADTPEKQARYLAIASAKAHSLDRLVADLFDYTRLEYLDPSLRLEGLDLIELLTDLIDGLGPQADAQDLTLELRPHHHAGPIEADRELLTRAITNLIDNAIRYTPAGGRIDITCGTTTDGSWFTVADSGPGIDPSDLPHLFEPLYRGDRARSAATGGAGLGLATAHRVIVAHHGTLEASNSPTGGAVLTARLPAAAVRPSPSA